MSGENKGVRKYRSFGNKIVLAFLVSIFVIFVFSSNIQSAVDKSKRREQLSRKQNFPSEIRLDSFVAEKYSDAVRIVWKTNFEENNLGFQLWREDAGQKVLVNQELIAGSLLKVRNAVFPAGSEYVFYDLTNSVNSYYWLEAIDINSKSRWFGPVFPEIGIENEEIQKEINERMASISANLPGQTEMVELKPTAEKNAKRDNLQSVAPEFLAGDQTALKMEIRNRGIYRIDSSALAQRGFEVEQSANWKLFVGGVEQPIKVNTDGSIEFFGEGIDTIQTDANVYWLITDTTPGQRMNRTSQNYLQSAQDSWNYVTAERRERTMRISSVLNGARENWFGSYISNTVTTKSLDLREVSLESGQTATLGINLQGISSVAHQVIVKLNDVAVGQVNFNAFGRKEWTVTVPLTNLLEGANTVTLQSLNGASDYSVTETIKITYPKRLKAFDNRLEFTANGTHPVKLGGFTTAQIRIFDISNPAQVNEITPESRLESDGTYSVTVAGSTTPRLLLAQGEDVQLYSANPLIENYASDLRNPQNQAKFVIITPREFFKPLYELRDLREIQGISTKLIDVEDIYDEFNNGVRSAEAIRSFFQYARQNWAVKPDFAMLVGDASSDPRNYSGMGGNFVNRVPTMFADTWNMEAATDEMMADFNGDSIGEIALGRLPAQTQEEAEVMTQKVIAISPMYLEELNGRGVHFVADDNIGYNFAASSRYMAVPIPAGVTVNYVDRTTQDPAVLRNDIINRINSGAAIVNYFGHGSITSWTSAGILRNADAASLFNPKRPPLMVSLACLNGDYTVFGTTSLAEAMMKRNQGGAFAVWAASGWNGAEEEELMGRDFYERVFAGMTLGEAARNVKSLYPSLDLRRTFIYFGDPTQRLVRF